MRSLIKILLNFTYTLVKVKGNSKGASGYPMSGLEMLMELQSWSFIFFPQQSLFLPLPLHNDNSCFTV